MRVVIGKKLLSTVGGSEAQARALAAALRDRGHDVTLVGLRPAWRRPGIPEAVYAAGPGIVEVRSDGLAFRFVPARGGRLGATVEGLLPTTLVDHTLLGCAGADVVHCVAREWAGAYERAARETGAAFVETPLAHAGQLLAGDTPRDVARYRRADALIALTEWEAAWYRARGARCVHVTAIGPILAPLPDDPRDAATILFVGRKERYKGYHALRAAAEIVWRERPDARFVAIGQRGSLARAAARPDERWSEQGVVSEAEKARAYARATVFAMPSRHETFGHTYLEAWCAGLPVVAGDIPPLREVVRDGVDGLLVPQDAPAIAGAILSLLADPARARAMGEAGRRRVAQRWNWEAVAERTERAYASALERRLGPT